MIASPSDCHDGVGGAGQGDDEREQRDDQGGRGRSAFMSPPGQGWWS